MESPIDSLFSDLFGSLPKKKGAAYEMLSAAVCKIMADNNVTIFHDEKMRGVFSKTLYQIDILLEKESETIFGEAKDYTERNAKVGRGDMQKLGGALRDLDIDAGIFFSATDYTKPAKNYAKTSQEIIGKEISLFHLRPVIEKDREGRIEKIVLTITVCIPLYEHADFKPVVTAKGEAKLQQMKLQGRLSAGRMQYEVKNIYDSNRKVIKTIKDLTSFCYGGYGGENARGSFWLPNGFIDMMGELVEIFGITYDIPFECTSSVLEIIAKGNPVLIFRDEHGNINKLITDEQLKSISFGENGEVVKK